MIADRMAALAADLHDPEGAGVRAYHDPAVAMSNRPCLLVTPPVLDYGSGVADGTPGNEWRVVALSSKPIGSLAAVVELDPLVEHARDVLDVERVEPGRYQLDPKNPPVPAYICTHFEIA